MRPVKMSGSGAGCEAEDHVLEGQEASQDKQVTERKSSRSFLGNTKNLQSSDKKLTRAPEIRPGLPEYVQLNMFEWLPSAVKQFELA